MKSESTEIVVAFETVLIAITVVMVKTNVTAEMMVRMC